MIELDTVRKRYRQFADAECRGYSDLYYRLALGAADEDSVMRFIADQPVIQPHLFLAAVQYVAGTDRMPSTVSDLSALLNERGADIAEIMATRHTQTNEIGRCSVLLPALPTGPLALIEVGASAGLCLLLDRFSYDYGSARIGLLSSPVRLRCALTNSTSPRLLPPKVVWRRGLDRAPIDVSDDDAVKWLRACVWSDHSDRRQRLEAAISLARLDPPPVICGDLVDDLAMLLAEAPLDAHLVVFHSAVLAYVSPERRKAFADVLVNASRAREIVWVSNEAPGVVSGFAAARPADPELRFLVARQTFRRGLAIDEQVLARAHPHGSEMTWLAEAG